jgi:hypothetical protein
MKRFRTLYSALGMFIATFEDKTMFHHGLETKCEHETILRSLSSGM